MMRTGLVLLMWALGTACSAQQAVTAGDLSLMVAAADRWDAATPLDPGFLRSASLLVRVGKEGEPVPLGGAQLRASDDTVAVQFAAEAGPAVSVSFRPAGRTVLWEVACENRGEQQLWLELGPELQLAPREPVTVFDGWDDFESPTEAVLSTRLEGNMPLVCCWSDRAAVGVGLKPGQLVSYLRHEYRPQGDGTAHMAALTRLVLDPGQTETVGFVTCATPGQWGKYEVFEGYYDSFPSYFVADPEVDRRASMGSAQYVTWPAREWSPEIARRLFGGWDWCYAPFRRTGDIVGRAELWDYTPVRPFGRPRDLPREQYLEWRQKTVAEGEGRCDVAMMFYIPSQIWCEETLAKERYADALTTDPKAKTYFDTPWVTGHDNELRVFPLGTSFGEQSRRDMAQLVDELAISGFAFDTAGDACRYLGPALPNLPHRAWDEQVGVYCGELVAIASLMDYAHSLRRDGRAPAVVANPMANGTYASCFHSDSAMLEANPWTPTRTQSDRLRWKMGHKTLVWWEGYDLENFIDADSITGEQLAEVYRGLADFTLLQSLRVGYIPPPSFTPGMAKLVRWLPAIVECVQTGWEPVPAARVPEPLWSSRYGKGLETLLAVAHETGEPVSGEVVVENSRLGEGAYLFSTYQGQEITNRLRDGETVVALEVPVRTPVVLRAQMAVRPAAALSEARVGVRSDVTSSEVEAVLTGEGAATVSVRVPREMAVTAVTVDGRPVQWGERPGAASFDVALEGETRVRVRLGSTVLRLTAEELLEYPFVTDARPSCTLVVSAGATERQRHAAFRLQEYFRYWHGRASQPASEVLLPIIEGGAEVAGGSVRFEVEDGRAMGVSRRDGDLIVTAPDDEALLAATFALLRALDAKYWHPETLPANALNRELGLAGKVLE